jgi:hypothetical protein
VQDPPAAEPAALAQARSVSEVLAQIDFASIHSYPILDTMYSNFNDSDPWPDWNWQQMAVTDPSLRAAAMMDAAINKTKLDFARARTYLDSKGKSQLPIIIGETGWKAKITNGETFRAHPANQRMYYERLATWAGSAGAPKAIFYFEAFDEPWKQGDDAWGVFNKNRQARYAIQSLGTCGTTWTCETGTYTDAAAVYFVPPVTNPAVTQNKYTIYSDAALGTSELRPTGLRFDPQFRFHFYDLDFCRQAELRALRMGTWSIAVVHESAGDPNNQSWEDAYQAYLAKYGE